MTEETIYSRDEIRITKDINQWAVAGETFIDGKIKPATWKGYYYYLYANNKFRLRTSISLTKYPTETVLKEMNGQAIEVLLRDYRKIIDK